MILDICEKNLASTFLLFGRSSIFSLNQNILVEQDWFHCQLLK